MKFILCRLIILFHREAAWQVSPISRCLAWLSRAPFISNTSRRWSSRVVGGAASQGSGTSDGISMMGSQWSQWSQARGVLHWDPMSHVGFQWENMENTQQIVLEVPILSYTPSINALFYSRVGVTVFKCLEEGWFMWIIVELWATTIVPTRQSYKPCTVGAQPLISLQAAGTKGNSTSDVFSSDMHRDVSAQGHLDEDWLLSMAWRYQCSHEPAP